MISQYIRIGKDKWNLLVYYNADIDDAEELIDSLRQLKCPEEDIESAIEVLNYENTGFTYTNTDYKMSIVCIGKASNINQFVSTTIHEAKHVQSHICAYYEVEENTEEAAYLIGYIVKQMYRMLRKIVKNYV